MEWLQTTLLGIIIVLLAQFHRLQKRILKKMAAFDSKLDDLEVTTTAVHGAVDSAIVLINGLSDKLDAALADDADDETRLARVTAVNEELKAKAADLAAAVDANDDVPDVPPVP